MIKSDMKFFTLVFLTRVLGILGHFEKRCESTRNSGKLISETTEYVCPREGDPVTFTECCDNTSCCERKSLFPEIDEKLVMIIGVTVITVCVILMIITVICCFWSKCPCYTTCRANYTASETIIYFCVIMNVSTFLWHMSLLNQIRIGIPIFGLVLAGLVVGSPFWQ